jgi:hypothetical protein
MMVSVDRLPDHVWGQLGALDEAHQERLAEEEKQLEAEANRPFTEEDLPPLDSHPNAIKASLSEVDRQIANTELWDTKMLEHLENERLYYTDLRDFYKDDWKEIRHALAVQRRREMQAKARLAREQKESVPKPEPEEKAPTHSEPPATPPLTLLRRKA